METPQVEFDRDDLTITVHLEEGEELVIRPDDVEKSFFSRGKGGQNVNRNLTGVQLNFHIPEAHRRNASKTRELVTRSISQRSRDQNMKKAFSQLAEKLSHYFYVPKFREPTHVPRRSKEKRLRYKKRRGETKKTRQKIDI